MKRSRWLVLAALTAALAALAATTAASAARAPYAASTTAAPSCSQVVIGLMAPITGPAATIGKEIRDWVRYSVTRNSKALGLKVRLIETDTQLDPAQASTRATQLNSNTSVLFVVGPAGSQEVIAADPIFSRTRMPFVSGSATATQLTNGSIPTFSRVVPNDSVQGPTTARFIVGDLKAKKIVIIDDQTAYSVPLANSVQANTRANNVEVQRESVNQQQTDFSGLVTSIGDDVDVVYLPWQIAANGQLFAQQMKEQGKQATIIGSDGLYSGDFTAEGAFVFSFAPDIRGVPSSRAIVRGFERAYNTEWGTFGPPFYLVAEVGLRAIKAACADGKVTRAEVARAVRKVRIQRSILGTLAAFGPKGDPLPAKFYRFQIKDGKPVLVG
jgi:branched-chain amino acid transport system substrate-binding protein